LCLLPELRFFFTVLPNRPEVVGGIEDSFQTSQWKASDMIGNRFLETVDEDILQREFVLLIGQASSGNLLLDSVKERFGGLFRSLLHSKEFRSHQALLFDSVELGFEPCRSGVELELEVSFSGFIISIICIYTGSDTKLVSGSLGIKLSFGRLLNSCIEDDDLPVNIRVGGCEVEFHVGQELIHGVTIEVPSCEGRRGGHW
jgi:hypothetical protein